MNSIEDLLNMCGEDGKVIIREAAKEIAPGRFIGDGHIIMAMYRHGKVWVEGTARNGGMTPESLLAIAEQNVRELAMLTHAGDTIQLHPSAITFIDEGEKSADDPFHISSLDLLDALRIKIEKERKFSFGKSASIFWKQISGAFQMKKLR